MSAGRSAGIVYLVGAGPGDPGLITVRGRQLIDRCDVIVYDALANTVLMADARRRGVEMHDVGKRGGAPESARQTEIQELLVSLAREGKCVVRLKGGDPFVFGRGSEEAQALAAAGIRFEIVPGVTAGIAAPAYAGIPVTHRATATSVTLVTGHEDPTKGAPSVDWPALAKSAANGTIVLYMGVKTLLATAAGLIAGGLSPDTPAAMVQWGTHPRQRTVVATLSTLAERAASEGVSAPVITVIGATVGLRDEIAWYEARPLSGRRIVVTRATGAGGTLADQLRTLGADVIEAPVTTIEELPHASIDEAIARVSTYQWLILTSQVGVRLFFAALDRADLDSRALAGLRIGVIGPVTRGALAERGIVADVVPKRFVAEGLLERLSTDPSMRGARVLYATAENARDVLQTGLTSLGASVDMVAMYRSIPDATVGVVLTDAMDRGEIDLVTFASGSAVEGYATLVGPERARKTKAISIGPVTTAAARAAAIEVVAEAKESSIDALIDAVSRYFETTAG